MIKKRLKEEGEIEGAEFVSKIPSEIPADSLDAPAPKISQSTPKINPEVVQKITGIETPKFKDIPNKYDVNQTGHYEPRKIELASDGNPSFTLTDDEYKSLINRKVGSRWNTTNGQLRDWIKANGSKTFWVVNKEDNQKKYLYVAPRRMK